MKKFSTVIISVLLFILIFVSSFTVYYIYAKTPSAQKKAHTNKTVKTEAAHAQEDTSNVNFMLKAQDGKLLLYRQESDSAPVIIDEYDIDISLLPEEDRNALSAGIITDSPDNAMQLIEDFSS